MTPIAAVAGGGGIPAGAAGTPVVINLNKGQHAQITQATELTGSAITSTKPVGLMAGQTCMNMPGTTQFCDHGEQTIPPVKALGRRYVAAFNRRHGRAGTLWEGRYRATVAQPQRHFIALLTLLEWQPQRLGLCVSALEWPWSSAAHHLGRRRDPLVTDHPLFWATGNTPFANYAPFGRSGRYIYARASYGF